MYAVIFKATFNQLDDAYTRYARQLRELAMSKYGCTDFTSVCEGNQEITLSYWNSLNDIKTWKNDAVHQQAQALGKRKWYSHYQVEIVEILREYAKGS